MDLLSIPFLYNKKVDVKLNKHIFQGLGLELWCLMSLSTILQYFPKYYLYCCCLKKAYIIDLRIVPKFKYGFLASKQFLNYLAFQSFDI